ncbi:CaiB/BaiF CoA transferase family protein [Tardiphaga sp. 538_B7_N1_4]|uniref:CaiB/BaiF CoA transferase family protein n=1 Tax=Tardiphaga sp. 538_B7_N1_4 TaxID=3240778 RepID=UPI001B8A2311|nr:CaiB/BaiF CoA-transferase family protein [Bradyrhizobium diazoefficiens]MBR0967333.1 CoA transferase [Bradyrhizobium diazoefficiens]MBR0976654.1 CoA transferase [Bradyrhizobium diazoefficiens]MBR1005299.1 CoA transferase [Bradyrhizobium diazoefficiens]MBR1011772.1 CoA transferase [Bradyrhizobium diazoefficiens]MBR1049113.1 CoA transferase [Bradyrhizobium diazoefficiens]
MHLAFEGLKVVDLSAGVAGPYSTMLLAQHGADVIKVETPHNSGDWARILGMPYEHHSAYSLYSTLGKRSVALDLKTPEGKSVLWRLIEGADIFVEGFRPGAIQRLGFSYEEVKKREPGIVYCSVSGFGQIGEMASLPAMDPVLQAFVGLTDDNRGEKDRFPHRVAISAIDIVSGLLGFQAIATTLYEQQKYPEKKGRFLEWNLMQGGATLCAIRTIAHYLEGGRPQPTSMPSGVYDTADGQINLTMVRPSDWVPFCEAIENSELLTDERFSTHAARAKNLASLVALVRPTFAKESSAWWLERLAKRGIMCARVNTYSEFLQEEQVKATGTISWLTQPGISKDVPTPNIPGLPPFENATNRAHAPYLGENTVSVLTEHGYSEAQIQALSSANVIKIP